MPVQNLEIGANYAGLVNIETMVTGPKLRTAKTTFRAYQARTQNADGTINSRGLPSAEWRWDGFIIDTQYDALRAICTSESTAVMIRTLAADYKTYKYYNCLAIWPEPSSLVWNGQGWTGFVLSFINLVEYTPPAP